jgi:hypothetical protein
MICLSETKEKHGFVAEDGHKHDTVVQSHTDLRLRNNGIIYSLKSFHNDLWLQKCKESKI